ncbi:MAG: hypothetical protein U0V54_02095 [Saprospiraceae bacterium]
MVIGNFFSKIVKISLTAFIITLCIVYGKTQTVEGSTGRNNTEEARVFMITLSAGGMQPMGAFKSKIHDMQAQFNLSAFGQMKAESPLFFGFELGYSVLQDFGTTLPFTIDGIEEEWNVETNSQILYTELACRYYFPFKVYTVDFFSEFNLGTNILFTTTTFTPPDPEEAGDTDTNKSAITVRYGAGLGFHVPVYEMLYLQGRVNYAAGLSTRFYAQKDSVAPIQESTIEAFELQKSTTDILKWDIGLTFTF